MDLIQIHDLEFSVSLEQVRSNSAMKKTFCLNDSQSSPVLKIWTGFNEDPDPDPDSFLPQIRIQVANPMRIHADPGLDPVQTLHSQKVEFFTWKI